MALPTASDNQFPKVILEEVATDGSATVTPAADHRALFLGEDGALHLKDSAAAVTDVGGAAGAPAFVGVRAYNNTTQSSAGVRALNAEDFDTDGFHDNATNNSRLTVPSGKAGYYWVHAYMYHGTGTARQLGILKNGAVTFAGETYNASTAVHVSLILNLSVGQYVEATSTYAGSTGHASADEARNFLEMYLIGT